MTSLQQRNQEIINDHLTSEISRLFPDTLVTPKTHPIDAIQLPSGHVLFVCREKILFVLYPVRILSRSDNVLEYMVRVELNKEDEKSSHI